jgi:hypothetical protein
MIYEDVPGKGGCLPSKMFLLTMCSPSTLRYPSDESCELDEPFWRAEAAETVMWASATLGEVS